MSAMFSFMVFLGMLMIGCCFIPLLRRVLVKSFLLVFHLNEGPMTPLRNQCISSNTHVRHSNFVMKHTEGKYSSHRSHLVVHLLHFDIEK